MAPRFAGSKNSRLVTFPVTHSLDLSPFMEEPGQAAEYRPALRVPIKLHATSLSIY